MRARTPGLVISAALAGLLVGGRPASACDSSSCLLVTRGQSGLLPKGGWRVDVSYRQTNLTDRLEGSEDAERVLRPKIDFERRLLRPGYHDEQGGRDRFLQVDVGYGIAGRTALLLSFPLVTHRAFDIGHGPVLAESYTTSGNGDLLLGVRHAFLAGRTGTLVAGLALEAPAGRHTLESPSDRLDSGILDPMLQPGSGSFDLVGSAAYAHRISSAALDVTWSASYQHNGTNDLDYHVGDDTIVSVSLGRRLAGPMAASLQLKWAHRARSTFVGEDVPATGGHVTYLTPGLSARVGSAASLYGFATIPIQRYVNEEQLAPRMGFVFGVSRTF